MLHSHLHGQDDATFHHPPGPHGEVSVTGSFCGWSTPGVPLQRRESGWFADVRGLGPGDLTYKMIVDGRWRTDPTNLTTAPDGQGGHNSLLPRDGRGTAHAFSFHSPAMGEARRYVIHLPAGHASGRRFPTLYLLHGALDGERAWLERGGLTATLEGLRAEGAVGDLIVVMPFEPGGMLRGDERAADYLARDVVGHVDFEFPTLAAAQHRAIDGLSSGGFTSLALAARRPDLWRSVGSMSGSFDDHLAREVWEAGASMRAAGQRHVVSCGRDEPHVARCRAMSEHLATIGLERRWFEPSGIHDWPVWRLMLGVHLRHHWEGVHP